MRIGPVQVSHPFVLAPMEEHTSFPLRMLMKRHGASLVCTERMDAHIVARRDQRAVKLLSHEPEEKPCAAQISGADFRQMADAARNIEEQGFDIVDLNFECPIRRLCRRGEGGFLLADPAAIERIVREVVFAVRIPVTLTIRTGMDAENSTALEVARRAESAGASALHVHARNVRQAYIGGADWTVVAEVKGSVSIPVIGSGAVRTAADAVSRLRESGADGVAIGRGCLGNPWIFQEARSLWKGGNAPPPPSPAERERIVVQLIEDEVAFYGAAQAMRRMARVSSPFARFLPDPEAFRAAVQKVQRLDHFRSLVHEHFRVRSNSPLAATIPDDSDNEGSS